MIKSYRVLLGAWYHPADVTPRPSPLKGKVRLDKEECRSLNQFLYVIQEKGSCSTIDDTVVRG